MEKPTFNRHRRVPPRLERVFSNYDPPLYFVTFCTMHRRALLDSLRVHDAFRKYARAGASRGAAVGRYVIMPNHVHLFVRLAPDMKLGTWVRGLKRAMAEGLAGSGEAGAMLWQPGFFDHILRNGESYAEKWRYVLENPVRAGLAVRAETWPYQGEIVRIEM
jgi:putative transposase